MEGQPNTEPAKKTPNPYKKHKRRVVYFFVSLVPLGLAWSFYGDYTRNTHCDASGKETTVVLEKKYESGKLGWRTFDFTFKGRLYSCLVQDDKYNETAQGGAVTLKYSERDDCFCDAPLVDKSEFIGALFFAILGLVLLADSLFPFLPSSLEGKKETR